MGNGQSQAQGNKHTMLSMQTARRNARQQILLKQKSAQELGSMSNIIDHDTFSETTSSASAA